MMSIKNLAKQFTASRFSLQVLEFETRGLQDKVGELQLKIKAAKEPLNKIKALLASKLLKDSHKLVGGHIACGSDDHGYGHLDSKKVAKEVKYLVLTSDFPLVIEAYLLLPDDEVSLVHEDIDGNQTSFYDPGAVAHGSTEQEAWAMALDLYCSEAVDKLIREEKE